MLSGRVDHMDSSDDEYNSNTSQKSFITKKSLNSTEKLFNYKKKPVDHMRGPNKRGPYRTNEGAVQYMIQERQAMDTENAALRAENEALRQRLELQRQLSSHDDRDTSVYADSMYTEDRIHEDPIDGYTAHRNTVYNDRDNSHTDTSHTSHMDYPHRGTSHKDYTQEGSSHKDYPHRDTSHTSHKDYTQEGSSHMDSTYNSPIDSSHTDYTYIPSSNQHNHVSSTPHSTYTYIIPEAIEYDSKSISPDPITHSSYIPTQSNPQIISNTHSNHFISPSTNKTHSNHIISKSHSLPVTHSIKTNPPDTVTRVPRLNLSPNSSNSLPTAHSVHSLNNTSTHHSFKSSTEPLHYSGLPKILLEGTVMWKLPLRGRTLAEQRLVRIKKADSGAGPRSKAVPVVSDDMQEGIAHIAFPPVITWCSPDKSHDHSVARELSLDEVIRIEEGRQTPAFLRSIKKGYPVPPEPLCFSLIGSSRTLDLAAEDLEIALLWKTALQEILVMLSSHPDWAVRSLRKKSSWWPITGSGKDSQRDLQRTQFQRESSGSSNEESAEVSAYHQASETARERAQRDRVISATRSGNYQALEVLLNEGAEVDSVDPILQDTPLMIACSLGMEDIAELCVAHKAQLDLQVNGGPSPLHCAVGSGSKECALLLLQSAESMGEGVVDILLSQRNIEGMTALHLAAVEGDSNMISLLLSYGADISKTDGKQLTVLHHCSTHGHHTSLAALLDAGGDVCIDSVDKEGNTALHYAAYAGHLECARILLETAANPVVRNNKGMTPYRQASAQNHSAVCELLLEFTNPSRVVAQRQISKRTASSSPLRDSSQYLVSPARESTGTRSWKNEKLEGSPSAAKKSRPQSASPGMTVERQPAAPSPPHQQRKNLHYLNHGVLPRSSSDTTPPRTVRILSSEDVDESSPRRMNDMFKGLLVNDRSKESEYSSSYQYGDDEQTPYQEDYPKSGVYDNTEVGSYNQSQHQGETEYPLYATGEENTAVPNYSADHDASYPEYGEHYTELEQDSYGGFGQPVEEAEYDNVHGGADYTDDPHSLEEFFWADVEWKVYQTEEGDRYYVEVASGHSQWEDPRTCGFVVQHAEDEPCAGEELTESVQESVITPESTRSFRRPKIARSPLKRTPAKELPGSGEKRTPGSVHRSQIPAPYSSSEDEVVIRQIRRGPRRLPTDHRQQSSPLYEEGSGIGSPDDQSVPGPPVSIIESSPTSTAKKTKKKILLVESDNDVSTGEKSRGSCFSPDHSSRLRAADLRKKLPFSTPTSVSSKKEGFKPSAWYDDDDDVEDGYYPGNQQYSEGEESAQGGRAPSRYANEDRRLKGTDKVFTEKEGSYGNGGNVFMI